MRRRMPSTWDRPPPAAGPRHDWDTIRGLLPFLWPAGQTELRVRVVVAMLLLAAAKGINVIVPLFYKHAVDALNAGHGAPVAVPVAVPVGLLLAYGLARVGSTTFAELRDVVFVKVAQRAIRSMGLRVFRHLHRLSLRFHLDRQTGGISRAVERGTKGTEFLLNFMLFNILPTLLEIALVTGVLWSLYDVWYAAITFTTIAVYIGFTLGVTEWRTKYRRAMNDSDAVASTKAIDSLLNFETVKYFGNEDHEAGRYDTALAQYEFAATKSKVTLGMLNIGQGAVIAAGLTAIMIKAGHGVADGTMTVGDFVLVNSYLVQLYMPLNFLGFVYREIKQSLTDMESMFRLLAVHAEVTDAPHARPLAPDGGEVRFDDVRFGYTPEREILKGVSFTVAPGRTVAIVGPSGAGKSTISRLLFRFYDVGGGRVLIDGQDVREVTQASLRAAIGIVPQDTVLFNDTIRYNIAYGRPGASQDDIEHAARLARIHDFVASLPEGYDTRVGERGLKLSGGEKQRVAIARTILKGPRILLFDEATSALDTHTEKEIQLSLREVSRDRTTLVIAHRLSTVVDADEILVLQEGLVVERGRHDELLAADGHYAEMWRKQQEAARLQQRLESELEGAE
ncbi:MAG: ABCB family ABC transporter ATP-binding protein/permease [Actinomycetota bacterium]